MDNVEITQADREAFARMEGHEPDDMGWRMITEPTQGDCAGVYAFARHRIAEREAVVKWLEGQADRLEALAQASRFSEVRYNYEQQANEQRIAAQAIEAGEHITPPTA